MNDTSRPSNGLSTQLPDGLPALSNEDKLAYDRRASTLRRVEQENVMAHALKNAATAQMQEIDMRLKETLTRMVNDFVTSHAAESKLMMDRYGGYNSDMRDKIEAANDEMKRAIRSKKSELETELRAGISTGEEIEYELKAFIDRQREGFQRLVELGNVAMGTIGDLYKTSLGKRPDVPRD